MLLFNTNLPLVEITVALAVVMFILLLEAIILLLLFSRQLSSASGLVSPPGKVRGGGGVLPSLPKAEKALPTAPKTALPWPPEIVSTENLPPQKLPPVLKREVLERELGRVQQQLSTLHDYKPPEGKVKTFLPPTGHEGRMVGQERLREQETFFTRLLRKDSPIPAGKEAPAQRKAEQKAVRDVQRIAQKVELRKTSPPSELARIEEELAKLKREKK